MQGELYHLFLAHGLIEVFNSQLLLRNVSVRKGIAFLEPETAILKGSSVDELEANQDANFARGIRMRLG